MRFRMQEGEPVVDLVDAEGKVSPCILSRVKWAICNLNLRIADQEQWAEVQRHVAGIVPEGEMISPGEPIFDRDEEDIKRPKKAGRKPAALDDDEEPESTELRVIPLG